MDNFGQFWTILTIFFTIILTTDTIEAFLTIEKTVLETLTFEALTAIMTIENLNSDNQL